MWEAIPVSLTNILFQKSGVLGVWDDTTNIAKPYSLSEFSRNSGRTVTIYELIGDRRVVIESHPESRSLRVVTADEGLRWMYAYWFGWYAFFAHAKVYTQP